MTLNFKFTFISRNYYTFLLSNIRVRAFKYQKTSVFMSWGSYKRTFLEQVPKAMELNLVSTAHLKLELDFSSNFYMVEHLLVSGILRSKIFGILITTLHFTTVFTARIFPSITFFNKNSPFKKMVIESNDV